MMFHPGDQYLITRLNISPSPGVSNQVNALGGAPGKNKIIGESRANKLLHRSAGSFKSGRSFFGKAMYATVNICVILAVIFTYSIDYGLRLLGCRGVIKINQRFVLNHPVKYGK